jgi:hypothetical protein
VTCIVCGRAVLQGLQCDVCRQRVTTPTAHIVDVPVQEGPKMTGPERAMMQILDMRQRQGEIVGYWYDSIRFRWGAGVSWFKCDFFVQTTSGFECIEVKGPHIHEDARKSFKAAAMNFPAFSWRMDQLDKGEWRTVYVFPKAM